MIKHNNYYTNNNTWWASCLRSIVTSLSRWRRLSLREIFLSLAGLSPFRRGRSFLPTGSGGTCLGCCLRPSAAWRRSFHPCLWREPGSELVWLFRPIARLPAWRESRSWCRETRSCRRRNPSSNSSSRSPSNSSRLSSSTPFWRGWRLLMFSR